MHRQVCNFNFISKFHPTSHGQNPAASPSTTGRVRTPGPNPAPKPEFQNVWPKVLSVERSPAVRQDHLIFQTLLQAAVLSSQSDGPFPPFPTPEDPKELRRTYLLLPVTEEKKSSISTIFTEPCCAQRQIARFWEVNTFCKI